MSESFADFYQYHTTLLEEIFIKTLSEDDVLLEGNLRYLLFEGELDQPDVEALRTQTQALGEYLQTVVEVPALAEVVPSAAKWFAAQLTNVGSAQKFVMKLDLADPAKAKGWTEKLFGKKYTAANGVAAVALIDQLASGGIAALSEALALLERNLGEKLGDDVQFINVPEDSGLTKEDIAGGIKKAFDKSLGNAFAKSAEGFMKKLGGKVGKLPNVTLTDFPVDAVMPELMNLTLPQLKALVEALPTAKIPKSPEEATADALAGEITDEEASGELSDDQIGKAGQAWLDKLKADGADASLMKIGKAWMAAVAKDPDFKKLAGLQESYRSSLTFLLFEQVKWPELVAVFSKNKPKMFSGLPDKTIEPLIAPFAQALADQGIDVVDQAGNPFKPPVGDTDEAIEAAEEEVDEEGGPTATGPWVEELAKKLTAIKGILNPEAAAQKISDLFSLGGDLEDVVEEGRRWSLYDLLSEKVVKYGDVVKALSDHLPSGDAEKIQALTGIHDIISKDFGKDFGIAEIPEPPADSASAGMVQELESQRAELDEIPDGIDDAAIEAGNTAASEALATETGMDPAVASALLDSNVPAEEALAAVPDEIKEDPVWLEKLAAAGKQRFLAAAASALSSATEAFGDLAQDFGEGVVEGVTALAKGAQAAFKELDGDEVKDLLAKISAAIQGGKEEKVELLKLVGSIAGEGAVKEALPEKLANVVLDVEVDEAATVPEVGEFFKHEDEEGKEHGVKIKEVDTERKIAVGHIPEDGKWTNKTVDIKLDNIGEKIEDEEEALAFKGDAAEGAGSIKVADFNSKISDAIDSVYGDDEELLDLIVDDQEKVPGILAKVSQELFADDFALEEALYRGRLSRFLFEGSYTWADVQKSIDKYSEDVPGDLLYAIFAKAIPSFKELGVDVSGVPEPDIEGLKAILSGEEIDPNAELDIEDPAGVSDEDQAKLDAEAKSTAAGLGKVPIDKNKLAAILKKHPDIVGQGQKATRARRKLRKAINMAAGMEVFKENFDYGWLDEDRYLLVESDEYDAMERWRQLAGIKDD
jgi:hypothetical protein